MNPDTDLLLERHLTAPPALVWRCWTEPELLKRWFCPDPWKVVEVEMDLRPGGIFRTVMQGPEGDRMDGGAGSYLLVEPERRLVWGDALAPGFRPVADPFMVADVSFAPKDGGTAYRAHVMHTGPEKRKQHEEMGFHDGWGTVAEQLDAVAQTLET